MSRVGLARLGLVTAAALGVAAVTAAVFLIRAGGAGPTNWPIDFELGSSDNGVLFQFAGDVFHSRPLDWNFSPQVFVFPEIPISLVAFLIAGGAVQLYYVLVAMINALLLFVAFFGVIRAIYPRESFPARLVRSLVTTAPLLLLPLLGTISLFEFQLAPTYYYGMYVAIVCWPLLYLVRRRWALGVVIAGIALIIASNPLTLIFTLPALACIGIVRRIGLGLRAVLRPLVVTVVVLVAAAFIRVVFFSGLQGTSPLSYIDASQVPERVKTLAVNLALASQSAVTVELLLVAAGAAVGLFVVAVMHVVGVLRKRQVLDAQGWALLYYGLVPVVGLLTCVALLILNYLYLWPILIAPFSFVLLSVPAPRVRAVGFATAGAVVIALIVSFIVVAPASPARYFSYRDPETRCLDSKLPAGMDVGYAGYFDARRLELTSTRPLLLIQIDYHGHTPYYWLTNKDYAAGSTGRFFYVDSASGQLTITRKEITSLVGQPDSSVLCPDGSSVLIYTDAGKLAKIDIRYHPTH